MGVVVDERPGLDQEAALGEVADDLVAGLGGREAVEPAVVVVEVPGLVDRAEHGQPQRLAELEVLGAGTRRDMNDPRPCSWSSETSSQGTTLCSMPAPGGRLSNGPS